ncbi:MAG: NADH-quinone oxidoreductase subunit L [Deltaproteobacteria bacterium]|nr:NADH-quinone oxidoreductase subunit L [Deltaproteobacteria bacterium]
MLPLLESMTVLQLAITIFASPLIAFAILSLSHHKVPRHGDWLAITALFVSFICSAEIFLRSFASDNPVMLNLSYSWLPLSAKHSLSGGILIDHLTAIMLVVVTLVSFLAHLFSVGYLHDDIRYGRYYCSLLLFTTSMLGLVLANNLLYLFISWELVGLSSYLLIGHWYEKKSASNAAIKAFITTRVGDVGMFLGLLVLYDQIGSLQYADVFAAVHFSADLATWQTVAGLGLFFGAMGKSAQFPLHVWLPDAMEAPTPVSALIHAATMVAAGVYLCARMLPIFDAQTLLVIAYIGAFTAVFAATIAIVQVDIKKVLAYSTVSQLGYMIMALGVGGYTSSIFHLTTHAFFKAGLFLSAGAVIYAAHHEQSILKFGGLYKKIPITATCYLLCTLALIGFPGFSGFWSKDAIIADVLHYNLVGSGHYFLGFAALVTVFLTAFYMCRQYFLTFFGQPKDEHLHSHAKDPNWTMTLPLIILSVLAVFFAGGGHWFPEYAPKKSGFEQVLQMTASEANTLELSHTPTAGKHQNSAAHSSEHGQIIDAHKLAMMLSTGLAFLGILVAYLFYYQNSKGQTRFSAQKVAERFPFLYRLLVNKYYLDELYHFLFVRSLHACAQECQEFDRKVIDGFVNLWAKLTMMATALVEACDRIVVDYYLVLGLARSVTRAGNRASALQTGKIKAYFVFSMCSVLALIIVLFFIV